MHKIRTRRVTIEEEGIENRSLYIALSYNQRIVDEKEEVSFPTAGSIIRVFIIQNI